MKIRSRIGVGIGIGISVVAVAMSGVVPANAQEPKSGVSSIVKFGVENLPCDGVAYPVAESWNPYTVPLRTPNILAKGAVQKLTYASETWTLDSVSDSYTKEASIGLEIVIPAGKAVLGYKTSTTTTYTHSTTVVPKEVNEIDLTAKVDGVRATPTAFKLEGWGQYYKCEVGTELPVQAGGLNTLKFDVTYATGWVLDHADGRPLADGDIG